MTASELELALEATIERVVRRVVGEQPAAMAPTGGIVTPEQYAADHSLCVATVRKAFREGRLPGERIGRAIRVRRDAVIGPPAAGRAAPDAMTPAAIAERILGRAR